MRPYFYTWSDPGLYSCKFTYVCIRVHMRTFTEVQFTCAKFTYVMYLYIYVNLLTYVYIKKKHHE